MPVRLSGKRCPTRERICAPRVPVLIAVIPGPLAETELRRALTVSEGDIGILMDSSITVILYTVLALALEFTGIKHMREKKKAKALAEEQGQPANA